MKQGVEFQSEPLFTELPRVLEGSGPSPSALGSFGGFIYAAKFPNAGAAQEARQRMLYIFYSAENLHRAEGWGGGRAGASAGKIISAELLTQCL